MAHAMFREILLEQLGGHWPEKVELQATRLSSKAMDGYRLEKWIYRPEADDAIPAYLLVPDSATAAKPAPAIAVWHQHNGNWGLGKEEPAGIAGLPMHYTGAALAREGYVVLCPDMRCFGERRDPTGKLKNGEYERFEFLRYVVSGKSLAWKNILDMRAGIDFLSQQPEVLADRIGCYGHSMGSTNTWMFGPWEPRLKCLVGNCCLPTYRAIHDSHILHCFPNFVPGIFPAADTPDIAALIAPRPFLLNFGETDSGSPIEEVRRGIEVIRAAYLASHSEDRFSAVIEPGVGHVLSDSMWIRTRDWFNRFLKG